MKEKFTFQQKTKLLTKLFDAGCNTEKKLQQLDIESFSYLGQLNNYITLLIQPVRKFFRAGRSCFYSLFSL